MLRLLLLELKNRFGLLRRGLLYLQRGIAVGRLYHRSIDELVHETLATVLILMHYGLLILHRWLLNHLVELWQLELRIAFLFGLDRLNFLKQHIFLLLLLMLNSLNLVDQSIIVVSNIVLKLLEMRILIIYKLPDIVNELLVWIVFLL